MEQFIAWLADTPWSIALHESLYMYSYTETLHVIAIMLFVGTIMVVDLRMLGVSFRSTPVSQVLARMLPWTLAGFIILTITGVMLFYAIPFRTWHSLWFRLKCILLIIGLINAVVSNLKVEHDKALWDLGPVPRKAKIAAIISLTVWTGVIVFGRLIAYNWTDCDHTESAIILQLEGCPAIPVQGA